MPRGGKREGAGRKPGKGPGRNLPPVEHRFPPGVSGNPKGRPANAGASLCEWVNQFAADGLSRAQIMKIATDDSIPWPKQAAAIRVLRTTESGDLADFDLFIDGDKTLTQLRKSGVRTDIVKKAKSRRRTFTDKDGAVEVTIEREVELHDRSGDDFDRISDRTDGRPKQRVDVKHDDSIRTNSHRESETAEILAGLLERLGEPVPRGAGPDQAAL